MLPAIIKVTFDNTKESHGVTYVFLATGNAITLSTVKSLFDGKDYYYINEINRISYEAWTKLMEELDRATNNN